MLYMSFCMLKLIFTINDFESKVGAGCKIDDSVVIEDCVVIGQNVTIGASTVIKHGTVIEDNVIIGCNTTIGSEGFQLIVDGKNPPIHVTLRRRLSYFEKCIYRRQYVHVQ